MIFNYFLTASFGASAGKIFVTGVAGCTEMDACITYVLQCKAMRVIKTQHPRLRCAHLHTVQSYAGRSKTKTRRLERPTRHKDSKTR